MKEALRHKMGKAMTIKISIEPDDQDQTGEGDAISQKSSDLAPVVKDSDEPGVIKNDSPEYVGEGMPPEQEMTRMQSIMDATPVPPLGAKTLESRAREKMGMKMDDLKKKKELKGKPKP